MEHLSNEQLYHLAWLTDEELPYDEEGMNMLDHLELCEECYDKFNTMLTLVEMTSESGMFLWDILLKEKQQSDRVQEKGRVLAMLEVVRNDIEGKIRTMISQMQQYASPFMFKPAPCFATRGASRDEGKIFRLEDVEKEDTYIVFDCENNEFLIRLNEEVFPERIPKVYLSMERGDKIEVVLTRKKGVLQGVKDNIPMESFKIIIEE